MKNDTIVIRAYEPATDLKPLSAIWLEASLDAHAFLRHDLIHEQQALIEEQYLPNAETWVACLMGQPVGFISLLDSFIGGLFVARGQQGRGIGRKLVAHALSLKGELSLEVYTVNEQAHRFYLSLGFRELSRRPSDDQGLPFENAHLHLMA